MTFISFINMNILEHTNFIRTTDDAITFLRERGILRVLDRPPNCPVCGQRMDVVNEFVMLAYFWARRCSNAMLEEFC